MIILLLFNIHTIINYRGIRFNTLLKMKSLNVLTFIFYRIIDDTKCLFNDHFLLMLLYYRSYLYITCVYTIVPAKGVFESGPPLENRFEYSYTMIPFVLYL